MGEGGVLLLLVGYVDPELLLGVGREVLRRGVRIPRAVARRDVHERSGVQSRSSWLRSRGYRQRKPVIHVQNATLKLFPDG